MEKLHFRVLLETDNTIKILTLFGKYLIHKDACQLYQILDCFPLTEFLLLLIKDT